MKNINSLLKKIEFTNCGCDYNLIKFIIYMTIDIHKAIGKLPILPKRGFTLPNMHYCGPYNPLNSQVIYDKNGNIIKYIQKPTGRTDEICSQHDIDYELSKNINDKHNADKK